MNFGVFAGAGTGVPAGTRLRSQEFLSSGTYVVPSTVTTVWVTMCGGGGGGNGIGGGAGGAFCIKRPVSVTPGSRVTVTIGAGGTSGSSGGATSFGSVSVSGGGVSVDLGADYNYGWAFGAYGAGGSDGGGFNVNTAVDIVRGSYPTAIWGRPGTGATSGGLGGGGGLFGDGGNGADFFSNASAAAANTGAGGGCSRGSLRGAGGSGRCIVEWFI